MGFVLEVEEQIRIFLMSCLFAVLRMLRQPSTVGLMISLYPLSSSSSLAGVPSKPLYVGMRQQIKAASAFIRGLSNEEMFAISDEKKFIFFPEGSFLNLATLSSFSIFLSVPLT